MNIIYLKNFLKSLLISIISFLVLTLFVTIFNYFNLLSINGMNISKIIIPIISMLIGSFYLGTTVKNKGWLEGIKFSVLIILLLIIINLLILKNGFEIKNLIYYIIILVSSMVGSMIGINRVEENK